LPLGASRGTPACQLRDLSSERTRGEEDEPIKSVINKWVDERPWDEEHDERGSAAMAVQKAVEEIAPGTKLFLVAINNGDH
jgi:hypothetical protein